MPGPVRILIELPHMARVMGFINHLAHLGFVFEGPVHHGPIIPDEPDLSSDAADSGDLVLVDDPMGTSPSPFHVSADASVDSVGADVEAVEQRPKIKLTNKEKAARGFNRIGIWQRYQILSPQSPGGVVDLWAPIHGTWANTFKNDLADCVSMFGRRPRSEWFAFLNYMEIVILKMSFHNII